MAWDNTIGVVNAAPNFGKRCRNRNMVIFTISGLALQAAAHRVVKLELN